MTEIKYLGSAIYDKNEAKQIIRKYFKDRLISNLTANHIKQFTNELDHKIELLKQNPELYDVRKDGVFAYTEEDWRLFTAHWFTVFYTYKDSTVYIWYIRSSKSDFSTFI
jgi:plasmid stabilization system protein ParE